ncbi:hypothetical protein PN498_16815 [Oscillatoria sp. CS-180]|nr:hypothetical protein [Oscillatoria sp. CS-180]MDB9527660.1 hypothetical protein [Oscillatoria sp. CS-180]
MPSAALPKGTIAIALKCEFNRPSQLGQKFRQLTGITPKAYRTQ